MANWTAIPNFAAACCSATAIISPPGSTCRSGRRCWRKADWPDLPEGGIEPFGLDESRRCRKPIVVAAQGVSFTVAVELMLAADIRVAASDARFAQLEVLRGFFPAAGRQFV